jgi:hypothetical protein
MLEQLPFFFKKCRQRKKYAKDSEVGTEMVTYMFELACCLLACLLAHNNCLLQTVRAADECRFLFMLPGRILESFEPTWGIFRGNLCIVSSHVSHTDPQRFLHHPHRPHPQFSKDCSFNVWDPKKCVPGLLEKCIWGPKKCVGGLKKWVWWGLPKKCGCRGLKTCVQGFKKLGLGFRSPPRNMCKVSRNVRGPKKYVQGLKKCERSQEIWARPQEMWD